MNTQEISLTGSKVQANLLQFILASNGRASTNFSLLSLKTGKHFTYKVQKAKPNPNWPETWFVKFLYGPDNSNDYVLCGMIKQNKFSLPQSVQNRGYSFETPAIAAFNWMFNHLRDGKELQNAEIWHSGRCGRCGKKLTVPESIQIGLGPECASRM